MAANPALFKQDTDVHVSKDDQDNINKFAKHNAKLDELKEELQLRINDLKSLAEAVDELELIDDDVQIPYVVGEVFINYTVQQTRVRLAEDIELKKGQIKRIEEKCRVTTGLMDELKAVLYRRFGRNIYLESDD